MNSPSFSLRLNLLITDVGFLLYWFITSIGLLPTDWLFNDYENPILVAWNWSFAPLDLLVSFAGISALIAAKRASEAWKPLALIFLTLTFCAGLMALAFWTLRQDFDPLWWAPNLYFMIWPLFFIRQLVDASPPNQTT
jgi:hypothetical protein